MTNPALSKVGRSLTYRSFQRKYCDVFAIQIPGVKGLKVGTRGSESEHGPWIARLRLPAVEHTAVGSCLLVFADMCSRPIHFGIPDFACHVNITEASTDLSAALRETRRSYTAMSFRRAKR